MVKRQVIIVFLVIFAISGTLLSGCTMIGKDRTGRSSNETAQTQENGLNPGSQGVNKEAILKDMLEIPMEDFEAIDLEGNTVKLSDYKGKIIFLNFWATWCPPCRDEMPFMEELYNEYKDQDVVILAVNSTSVELRGGNDSSKAESLVKTFVKSNGYTFPILLDKDNKAWGIYQQRGIPTNYVVDKQGIIRYGFSGAYADKEHMITLIENIRAIE